MCLRKVSPDAAANSFSQRYPPEQLANYVIVRVCRNRWAHVLFEEIQTNFFLKLSAFGLQENHNKIGKMVGHKN